MKISRKVKVFALALSMACFFALPCAAEDDPAKTVSESENVKEKKTKKKDIVDEDSGWKEDKIRSIDETFGSVRLRAKTKKGTFNIAIVDDKNYKSIPVLTTASEYNSTGFFLKAGEKIYDLNSDTRVKYTGWKTDNGMVLGYRVENVADVLVYFDCFQSDPDYDLDSVKITVTTTNKGKKKAKLATKLVLDTVLGETDRHHFYTWENLPVKNEISIRTLEGNPWYVSKNSLASMQIILDGGEATKPELFALANYSTLENRNWEPDLLSYRSFDTVLAYNNSACEIVWKNNLVPVKGQVKEVFYISMATGDRIPSGAKYLGSGSKTSEIEETIVVAEEKKEEIKTTFVSDEPVVVEEKTPVPQIDVATLTQEQLSPDYIQKLLNRIAVLEESDSSLNKEELLQLNAELDAILEAIRM